MKNSINIIQDQGEIVVTIKLPMDQFVNPLVNLLYHKIKELNIEVKEALYDSSDTIYRMDVCKLLNVSQTTMTKRIKDGSIPYSKFGSRYVFSKKEVLAAIKKTK